MKHIYPPVTTPKKLAFPAMAATYCLGVFNDNYFKQAAMLLSVSMGLAHLQGWATMLFALPFILFSAHGGWCADKFAKKNVIIAAKALELIAMLIGAAGLLFVNWPCILAMVFLMGLQSTFFSPALNGSIPELFQIERVPKVNAILKLVTTLAILIGIATAGISLDQQWISMKEIPYIGGSTLSFGIFLVALVSVFIALFGFFASFGLTAHPAAGGNKPFPWMGPLRSFYDLKEICCDHHFRLAIFGDAWFYGLASLAVLLINTLGLAEYSFSQTSTSLLSMMLMLGVCFGAFLAAKFVTPAQWSRYLGISALGMGAGLVLAGASVLLSNELRFIWLAITLTATGIAGGLFLIPVATLLQIRPAESDKGRVLAAGSFLSFAAILAVGLLFSLVEESLRPSTLLFILGWIALAVGALFHQSAAKLNQKRAKNTPVKRRLHSFLALIAQLLLALRYRVHVHGLDDIETPRGQKPGILFLANHPALIDPVIITSRLFSRFAPRPLADSAQVDKAGIRQLIAPVRPILIPDLQQGGSSRRKIFDAIQEVSSALERGDNVLLYPAGRLSRDGRENLGRNSGVEYILRQQRKTRVVIVRTTGLWGSSFSYAQGKPALFRELPKYLLAAVVNFLFFIPKREVCIDCHEILDLRKEQSRETLNSRLEMLYNNSDPEKIHTPYFFWQNTARKGHEN